MRRLFCLKNLLKRSGSITAGSVILCYISGKHEMYYKLEKPINKSVLTIRNWSYILGCLRQNSTTATEMSYEHFSNDMAA